MTITGSLESFKEFLNTEDRRLTSTFLYQTLPTGLVTRVLLSVDGGLEWVFPAGDRITVQNLRLFTRQAVEVVDWTFN